MTTTKNNEHKKLNFSSEREQSQACLNSAEHEKNQGRKVLNVPNKREQNQTCLDSAEREGLRPKGNVPNLRFPEFQGEWEKTKFGDIATGFDYGMNAAAKNYDGVNKYIRITDIDEASSTYTDKDIVSPDGVLTDNYLVNNRDILLARTGASTGKSYLYKKSDGKLYYAGFLIRANVTTHDPYFVFSQLHTHRYWRWVSIMSARSGQPGINSQEYSSFPIYTTSIEEENKIAKLLSLLDERIATQNKIIDKLQSLIKGISSRIFASIQGIEYRMGDIVTITNGNSNVQDAVTQSKDGLYPFFDRSEDIKYLPTFLFDKEAIIYPGEGTEFMPRYFKGKFALHQRCYAIFDFNEIINARFLYFYLKTRNSYFVKNAVGSTVPSLRLDTFQKLKVIIPPKKTQHSVSSFLSSMEQKRNVEKKILYKLLNQKQYLLRQMLI